ncbi:hypothetical protein ElyMa_002530700 [Elysia marginata]|uniref:Uncharacterized protein n=1 Tax=Elysia marginata TaxID=1093978 RepID=A0AAV4GUI7_9GAST|nr:hypothetical protein ElyMa_002530700 [Elysia marginata]
MAAGIPPQQRPRKANKEFRSQGGLSAEEHSPAAVYQPDGQRRLRAHLIDTFRSPQNVAYLRKLFAQQTPPGALRRFALETLEDSVYSFEWDTDFGYSGPTAQRGGSSMQPTNTFWRRVGRLNLIFFKSRMRFLWDKAALIAGRAGDEEHLHYRLFLEDSLHPPGLEELNGVGPLLAASGGGKPSFSTTEGSAPFGLSDQAWSEGDPLRTPEKALAEYWGEAHVESSTTSAAEDRVYIDRHGRLREKAAESWPGRHTPKIPIWRNLSRGRHGYDREFNKAGGCEMLESHVRKWNIKK